MVTKSQKQMAEAVLASHGRTYCDELGIDIDKNQPSPLFRWLTAAILFSARISTDLAAQAAAALAEAGYTTPDKMAAASWQDRVDVLTAHGYKRYDESTSRMLGETAERLITEYAGDLRQLRDAAECDPEEERRLLKEFKGLGDVGVDIFFREAQDVWDEVYPFVDRKAAAAARRLELPQDAEGLAALVARKDFAKLVAGLVRIDLADDYKQVAR